MQSNAGRIALGGMLAGVAIVIMCLGGYIPVATYVCPMLCCMTQFVVLRFCGKRLAWTWFAAVCFLSVLFAPDKEAAMVFLAVGCYPMLKPRFEQFRMRAILKLLFFNTAIVAVYFVMIYLLGMEQIASENTELGIIGLTVVLLLGNVTFVLLDKLLTIMERKIR